MQKAGLSSAGAEDGLVITQKGLQSVKGQAMADVFDGCMAQRGYRRGQ